MLRKPSGRKHSHQQTRLNLIPILDAVFIFIFFLLMSANFIKIFEINSDVPIISNAEPPKKLEKQLALTVKIVNKGIQISTGLPSKPYKFIAKKENGDYDTETLHNLLFELKERNMHEDTAIFEPVANIKYEELVRIMDAVRTMYKTDKPLFKKSKDGLEEKMKFLFEKIVFGNLMS